MRILAALLILLVAAPAHAAVSPPEIMKNPALEARAENLYHELRCVVCRSQSLADSDSQMAAALRSAVRERLSAGDSDADILAYMRSRYGDSILMSPPFRPGTWLLWLMPLLVLAAGGVLATRALRRKT